MKLLHAKYIYPLVVLSMLISVLLQLAWLRQLFGEEKRRASNDIENMVAAAAQHNILVNLDQRLAGNTALNNFLLTPEWEQIWMGFDRAKDPSLYKSFLIYPRKDSTEVRLRFVFLAHPPAHRLAPKFGLGYSPQQMRQLDSISLIKFENFVHRGLDSLHLHTNYFFFTHNFNNTNLKAVPKNAEYVSKIYSYNTINLNTAQLVIYSFTGMVWYRMRYYLISSFFTLILSATAFYFILRLMITRRMYADARVAFTSNMTHEIKTPIATVALALESISKYELINDPEKMERYLNMGKQELQRLSHLVEKVLSLSQEDDQIKLNPVFYDVQAGLADVIHSMELPLKNAGAVCELVVSPEPCFIEGDAVHLTTVFFNLIENAIKYALDPLKLIITCSCNDDWISISFADNGPGIPEIYQQKIFERYFRIPQPGQTHPVKGSGLGLNYVFGVIQSHHGTIMLKSEMGLGSTFTIKLPGAKYEG